MTGLNIIHNVAATLGLIFSLWESRKHLTAGDFAESIWWLWVATLIVMIG